MFDFLLSRKDFLLESGTSHPVKLTLHLDFVDFWDLVFEGVENTSG